MFGVFRYFPIVIAITLGTDGAMAQGTFKGYMFGDYYYMAKHHDPELKNRNGFWFRRIYLTHDNKLSDQFSIRLRMELNSTGDLDKKDKIRAILKDGYLKWRQANHSIVLGLSPSPAWNFLESVWGYRSVVKTPGDLYKFGSSREFGIAFQGKTANNKGSYHFMLANGSGTDSETNAGKKLALALGYRLAPSITFEVYGDYESRPGGADRYTGQGFLGYQGPDFTLGLHFMHQTRQEEGGEDVEVKVGSVFATAALKADLHGFFRFDRAFDPIPDGPKISYLPLDGTAKFNFLVFGVDYQPHKQVHLMPNIEVVLYDNVGDLSLDSDIIPRFTFYYTWK